VPEERRTPDRSPGTLAVLFVGDIVGEPGRRAVKDLLPGLRQELDLDLVVANAENAAGGSGITSKIAAELLEAGCDVLTSGDHVFRNKEVFEIIDREPRLLRPLNVSPHAAGRGLGVFAGRSGARYGVANLLGRIFMAGLSADCPFAAADRALEELAGAELMLFDFHAEATSEKVAMRYHLDGRAAALVGTHTHVPTADACVTAAGTAYITDLGLTGPWDSVLGRTSGAVLHHFRTQMPARFSVASGDVRLAGAVVRLDRKSGRAVAIERVEQRTG